MLALAVLRDRLLQYKMVESLDAKFARHDNATDHDREHIGGYVPGIAITTVF